MLTWLEDSVVLRRSKGTDQENGQNQHEEQAKHFHPAL